MPTIKAPENYKNFKNYVIGYWQSYFKDSSKEDFYAAVETAYDVYLNAYNRKEPFLIAGRHSPQQFHWGVLQKQLQDVVYQHETDFNEQYESVTPIPVGIVIKPGPGALVIEYKTLSELSGETGAILSSNKWTMLINDSWIMEGIHSRKTFVIVSPLSWYNLWTRTNVKDGKNISWEEWYETRKDDATLDDELGRMTITAREVLGLIVGRYKITRHGAHLITAEPRSEFVDKTSANWRTYLNHVNGYILNPKPYQKLKNNIFKELDRNVTFHASTQLIINGQLTTVQEYCEEHKEDPSLPAKLRGYDPQGQLYHHASEDAYTLDDLNKGLAEVFAGDPSVAYVLDLRGANLSGVDPFSQNLVNAQNAQGNKCYLNLLVADLSGAKFIGNLNGLFKNGIYNGTDFSNADLSAIANEMGESTYDNTTQWPEKFQPASNLTVGFKMTMPANQWDKRPPSKSESN